MFLYKTFAQIDDLAKLYAKKIPDTDAVENFGGVSKRLSNIYAVNGIFTKVSTDSVISDYDLSQSTINEGTKIITKQARLTTSGFLIVAGSAEGYSYPCVGLYHVSRHGFQFTCCVFELGKYVTNSNYADIKVSIDSNSLLNITVETVSHQNVNMYYSFKRNLCL